MLSVPGHSCWPQNQPFDRNLALLISRITSLLGNPRHIKCLKVQTCLHSGSYWQKALSLQVLGHDIGHNGRFLCPDLPIAGGDPGSWASSSRRLFLPCFSICPPSFLSQG